MTSENSNQTIITVVSSDATKWCVQAICFDTDFEMEPILSALPGAKVLDETPLVVDYKGAFASFLPYGVLVYWAGNEEILVEMLLRIEKNSGHGGADQRKAEVQKGADRLAFAWAVTEPAK